MSARQEARDAVAAADIEWDDWSWKDLPTQTADVASDVWEPIVKDLVNAMESYRVNPQVSGWTEPLRRAREALG